MSRDSHGGWSDAAVCVFGVENWTKQSRPLKGVKALLQAMHIFQYQAYDFDLILLFIAYIKSSSFCFQMTIFDSTIWLSFIVLKSNRAETFFREYSVLYLYTLHVFITKAVSLLSRRS